MPTHRDKPDGFEDAARRRSDEVDAAEERARRERGDRWYAELRERDRSRAPVSVPPPQPRDV